MQVWCLCWLRTWGGDGVGRKIFVPESAARAVSSPALIFPVCIPPKLHFPCHYFVQRSYQRKKLTFSQRAKRLAMGCVTYHSQELKQTKSPFSILYRLLVQGRPVHVYRLVNGTRTGTTLQLLTQPVSLDFPELP